MKKVIHSHPGLFPAELFSSDILSLKTQGENKKDYWVLFLGSGKYYWVKKLEDGNYWTEAAGEDREFSSMREAFVWVDMELDGGKNKEEIIYLVDCYGTMRSLLYDRDRFIKGFRTADGAFVHLQRIQSLSASEALLNGWRIIDHFSKIY